MCHSKCGPSLNPDDPADEIQLGKNMALARALAEYVIEHEYRIPDEPTYRAGHSRAMLFDLRRLWPEAEGTTTTNEYLIEQKQKKFRTSQHLDPEIF